MIKSSSSAVIEILVKGFRSIHLTILTLLDLVVDDDAPLVVPGAGALALLQLLQSEDALLLGHVAVEVGLHPVLDHLCRLKGRESVN